MKTGFLIFIFSILLLTGCKYERTYTPTSDSLSEVLVDEEWKIRFFSANDNDRTGEFANHKFVFTTNYVVSSFNPVSQELQSGSYSIRGTDSTVFLAINFGFEPKYQDFNYEWQVMEITSRLIQSEHGLGGNGNTSYLTFEK